MLITKDGKSRPKILYFKDRKKLAESIILPENNERFIIIPPNSFGMRFGFPEYSKHTNFIQDRISEHDYI